MNPSFTFGGSQSPITRLSKTISVGLVMFYLLYRFVPSTHDYLTLVPGRTLPCVWNLVTSGFISTSIYKVVFEVIAVLVLARIIEPVYGSREFLKFILLVDAMEAVATFVIVYCLFAATANPALLYLQFSGFHGILAGLLVALKQVMPEHEIKLLGFLGFKVKFIPAVYVVVGTIACLTLKQVKEAPFLLLGGYVAWLYLRFFQTQADTDVKGDPNDDFRFATFFPGFLHGPVDTVAAVLSFIFRLKHRPGSEQRQVLPPGSTSILGTDSADANRRRERGAKALQERLGMKKTTDDVEAGSPLIADLPKSTNAGS